MASVRFFGRDVPLGSGRPEDRQRDSQQGHVVSEMVDQSLPQSIAHFKELQKAKAAQAKQQRDDARAIAKQFNLEVDDEFKQQ